MSSSKSGTDLDESVICLDSSDVVAIDSDTDETNQSVTEIENLEKTLPPGVAPEGFIIIDETPETPSIVVTESNDEKNDEAKPMFKIVFKDETVSRLYKKRVRDFFHRLVSAESKDDDSDTKNLVLEIWSKKTGRKRTSDHFDGETINKVSDTEDDCNLLFRIEKRPTLQDRLDVPTYGKKFEQILESGSGSKKPEEEAEKMPCRSNINCWNCMGNHSIRDCPQPRNQMEISKNRNVFAARAMQKVGRYHVENDEQKYDRFVPGQISEDLKRALGIRDNELPQHIYRMRMLGYPPGWLKEARLQHSGMNLYDADGSLEADPMEEPGQIVEAGDKDLYDVKKIQEFPGFNVRPPSGTKEVDRRYWKSDQYAANSKEALLSMIHSKKVDGYKRKKFKRNEQSTVLPDQIPRAMDIDCTEDNAVEMVSASGLFVPPLPKSPTRPPLPSDPEEGSIDSPKPLNLDMEAGASPIHVDSPSLIDLERRKKQLLDELYDSSSSSAPTTPVSSKTPTSFTKCIEKEQESTISQSDETSRTKITPSTNSTPSRGTIKSVNFGTPILPSTSPYNKLPSVENFAKDVCDLMNFENLPDATGKYEQMTGILQKVRSTLATIQND